MKAISSMATRQVLAELAHAWERRSGDTVTIESVGGVDAARRVQAGEAFDAVFLAADAIDKLIEAGSVLANSKADLFRSPVAVAVRAGRPRPAIDTEASLRQAVLDAPTIGYSTGPSGTALMKLFERWEIAGQIKERLVQAPPGVPVGSLVASGVVTLGFQQLSELMHLDGIELAGPLPAAVQIVTTFSGGICTASPHGVEAGRLLAFLASGDTAEVKQRHGMQPA